jgi:hypothetical protein
MRRILCLGLFSICVMITIACGPAPAAKSSSAEECSARATEAACLAPCEWDGKVCGPHRGVILDNAVDASAPVTH